MEYITGRVAFIGDKTVISKDNATFSKIILVIKKKQNNKLRNIAFECYGRIADYVSKLMLNDKVEIDYYINSNKSKNGSWYTSLHAKGVEKMISRKKEDFNQQKLM